MQAPKLNTHVRIRRGNTVDTARVRGDSLAGMRAVTISKPEISTADGGPDGVKEERVAVAIYDDGAPTGVVTIPTRYLEHQSRTERVKARIRGIFFGTGQNLSERKPGAVRERTIYRRGEARIETTYDDGSVVVT